MVILAGLLFSSCKTGSKKAVAKEDYVQELKKDASSVISKTIGDITYSLIYKPLDYMVLTEAKDPTEAEYIELKKEYSNLEYYTLEIMIKDFNDEILKYRTPSQEEYAQKVEYYSFGFQKDIFEIIDRDTLPCVSYHFERNYGISPKIRFNLAFASSASEMDRTVYINNPYLNTGPVKMTFMKKDLNNLPVLKF